MSNEIKQRQYFKPDDFKGNCELDYPRQRELIANVANEKLAPVLQMMSEMATAIDNLADGRHIFPGSYRNEVLAKYKSFIAQNGLGEG